MSIAQKQIGEVIEVTDNEASGSGLQKAQKRKIAPYPTNKGNETKKPKLVDPETGVKIVNPNRPSFDIDEKKKIVVLQLLLDAYSSLLWAFADNSEPEYNKMYVNVSVSTQIVGIIFTLHNVRRQKAANPSVRTNMIVKTEGKVFDISYLGNKLQLTYQEADEIWIHLVTSKGQEYKKFKTEDEKNWYGTIGPYIAFLGGLILRLSELRMGHHTMPIGKEEDGRQKAIPLSKYGLSGAHHVLLEGCSYPPERRSAMAQSVEPMTAFLCMLQSDGDYRSKWEKAVKRALAHIPIIDDIIEISKTNKQASNIREVIQLLADISLITTTRQATRMHIPICMLKYVYDNDETGLLLKKFNVSGKGAFYVYKKAQEVEWTINGKMDPNMASQIAFHYIMGTYKEDLGVLAQITNVKRWFNREQMKDSFKDMKRSKSEVTFRLPELIYYAKLSSANQTGLLSGVYTQISSIPAFSGERVVKMTDEFFEHCTRKVKTYGQGKTLPKIIATLTNMLSELCEELRKNGGMLTVGTVPWREKKGLTLEKEGEISTTTINAGNIFFMGKSSTR